MRLFLSFVLLGAAVVGCSDSVTTETLHDAGRVIPTDTSSTSSVGLGSTSSEDHFSSGAIFGTSSSSSASETASVTLASSSSSSPSSARMSSSSSSSDTSTGISTEEDAGPSSTATETTSTSSHMTGVETPSSTSTTSTTAAPSYGYSTGCDSYEPVAATVTVDDAATGAPIDHAVFQIVSAAAPDAGDSDYTYVTDEGNGVYAIEPEEPTSFEVSAPGYASQVVMHVLVGRNGYTCRNLDRAPTMSTVRLLPLADAGLDASTDAAVDASTDAAGDASADAAVDASTDAAVDASTDAD